MTIKLNLLPEEDRVSGGLAKLLKTTKMLGVIAVAFFIVFTLGVSTFFVLSTITLNNLNSDVDSLTSQITSLETTEQQIVLLKDRVGKIKIALNSPSAIKNLDSANTFISNLGPSSTLGELDIDSQKVDIATLFTSTTDTSAFITALSNSTAFRTIVMTSFGYSATTGYQVSVHLTN